MYILTLAKLLNLCLCLSFLFWEAKETMVPTHGAAAAGVRGRMCTAVYGLSVPAAGTQCCLHLDNSARESHKRNV